MPVCSCFRGIKPGHRFSINRDAFRLAGYTSQPIIYPFSGQEKANGAAFEGMNLFTVLEKSINRFGSQFSFRQVARADLFCETVYLRKNARNVSTMAVDKLICLCNHVTEKEILFYLRKGAGSLADIQHLTHAGTGCGRCRGEISKIIERFKKKQAIDNQLKINFE